VCPSTASKNIVAQQQIEDAAKAEFAIELARAAEKMKVKQARAQARATTTATENLKELCSRTMSGYEELAALEPLSAATLALQEGFCITKDPVSLSMTINSISQESITETVADALVKSVFTLVRKEHEAVYYAEAMVVDAIQYAGANAPEPKKFTHQLLAACENNLRRAIHDNHGDGPGACRLPVDVRNAVTGLARAYSEPGMLRYNKLLQESTVKEKDFSALFGFVNLDSVNDFADSLEELVPWKTCRLETGIKRVNRLAKERRTSTINPFDVGAPEALAPGVVGAPDASGVDSDGSTPSCYVLIGTTSCYILTPSCDILTGTPSCYILTGTPS